jgi:hypothetical protein
MKAAVIEKVKKLLALANSSNEHEAALAASHAQRLLAEHNLAMGDIQASERPDRADRLEMAVAKKLPKWLRVLIAGIGIAFDCRFVHYATTGKLVFIGVGADVEVAVYTFSYLEKTLRRLCTAYMKEHVSMDLPERDRELMRQSYYVGAAMAINRTLTEQRKKTPVTQGALVVVKDELIQRAMDDLGQVRMMRHRKSFVHSDAYERGQADGDRVGLVQGITNKGKSGGGLLE